MAYDKPKVLYPTEGAKQKEYIESLPMQDYLSTIEFSKGAGSREGMNTWIKKRRPNGAYRKSFGNAADASPDQKHMMPIECENGDPY